jgi:peptide/nickel transport system permease protein
MGLRSYVAKRLVYSLFLILVIIFVNFAIFKMMPGDPTAFMMQAWTKESPESRRAHQTEIREMWGLNETFWIQLVKYSSNLLTFQFGVAFVNRRPISETMVRRVPYTILLLGLSTIIAMIIGIFWGIAVIQKRGSIFDTGSVISSLFLGALPTFWLALIILLTFYSQLHWFPNAGAHPREWAGNWPVPFTLDAQSSASGLTMFFSFNLQGTWTLISGYVSHLILPLVTLTIFFFGGWLLLTRATMLETITDDYVLTARAKGLTERGVLLKHALKNASLPIITSAALSFAFMLTGAIITETVFTYPGVGTWTWESIQFLDYPVLMAIFYITSIAVVLANIIADLIYGIVDPRIKYG